MAIDDIIARESGGDPNARNPSSSAGGLGQFIDSTWLDMLRRHRPDIATGKSTQELLSLKFDPTLSREMTAAYGADNGAILSKAGLPVTPGTTYLAHFAGPQGAVKVLSADPATPVVQLLGPDAVAANPFTRNMTAGDLRAWADGGKRSVGVPAQGTPTKPTSPTYQQPANPDLGSVFTNLAPAQSSTLTVPTFAPQIPALSARINGQSEPNPVFEPRTYARERMKRQAVLA
ncbi:MAG: hypothetical protein ACXWLZ_00915 [Rhizomicrobium sp.]